MMIRQSHIKRIKKRLATGLFTLSFFALLPACVSDEHFPDPVPPVINELPRVFTLTLQIPGNSIPTTYALGSNEENTIQAIDILVFKITKEGEFFMEHIPVDKIGNIGSISDIKQVSITLEEIDTRLVVLANARELFTSAYNSLLADAARQGNTVKQELLERLTFDLTKPWNTGQSNGSEIRPFPMYGESGIIPASATEADKVKMKRALCRIDVGVDIMDTSPNGFANYFDIDSVFTFNTKNKGYIAPAFDSDGTILEKPHMPADAAANAESFGYKYEVTNDKGLRQMERRIYITEDDQASAEPTVLVIKAKYKEKDYQYFRIDLKNSEGRLIPFLRNYRYRINITGMAGGGYPSAEEAARAMPSLDSSIDANELELRVMEFNDYYMLGLETDRIVFNGDGSWNGMSRSDRFYSMDVYTTYSGWSVSWKDNNFPGWLEWTDNDGHVVTEQETHFPVSVTTLKIKTNRNNTSGKSRSATLIIRAGSLKREVTVIQNSLPH